MRPGCMDCTRKHLASAVILLREFRTRPDRYAAHFWLAIGELEQASQECEQLSGDLSREILAERLNIQESPFDYSDGILDLIDRIIRTFGLTGTNRFGMESDRGDDQKEDGAAGTA